MCDKSIGCGGIVRGRRKFGDPGEVSQFFVRGASVRFENDRKNDTGKPELYEQPEIFRLKVTKVLSDPATSFSEISTDIHRHLKACDHPGVQAFPMGAAIGREDFQKGQYVYREVFSFADAQAAGPGIREIPGIRTVVMVCREKDGDIRLAYQKIRNYLKEQALQLSSDLYSLSIVNVIDPNAERKYLKYIIACVEPVKSMSERHRGLKITRK